MNKKPIFNIREYGNVIEDNFIKINIGEEIKVMDGVQPFMFLSDKGTIIVQAQLPYPPGYKIPKVNTFPGFPGTVISHDGGRTWKRWLPGAEQCEGPIIEGCVTQLNDGTILILDWVAVPSEDPDKVIGKIWVSNDDWETVEGPFDAIYHIPGIKTDGFDDGGHQDGAHAFTGTDFHRSIIKLPDGNLLATIYCWFKEDNYPCSYEPSMKKFRTILVKSKDKGKNWFYLSTVASGDAGTEGFNEPVLLLLTQGKYKGRLICIMRTGRELYSTYSDDSGLTWSEVLPVKFDGIDVGVTSEVKTWFENEIKDISDKMKARFGYDKVALEGAFVDPDLIEMHNGVLVCAFGVRIPERGCWVNPKNVRNGSYIAFSFDQGQSWSYITQLISGIETTHYMSIREINTEELYVIYDILSPELVNGRAIIGRKIKVEVKQKQD